MRLSALRYYLSSIPTLLMGVKNWPVVMALAARRPAVVALRRPPLLFQARSLMDLWIIKETCLDRAYEALGEPLQDGWIVLDIGAGLGDFTLYVARQCPHSRVYAYEPFPESFELLQHNLRLNGVDTVRAFPYAVSDRASASLTLARTGEAVQHRTTSSTMAAQTVDVPSLALDQIFADPALSHCDFLKIDCEGAEYGILFGANDQTLSKLRRVSLEYHEGVTSHSHADLVRWFQDKGFQVKTRPNPVHHHLGLLFAWKAD